MKKIKVLFPFVGDTYGGSHISALSLIQNLPKDQYEIDIILYKTGFLSKNLKRLGVEYLTFDDGAYVGNVSVIKKIMSFFYSNYQSLRFLKNNNYDIIHTNDLRMHYSWVFACWLKRVPHVWHQRNDSKRGVLLSIFSSILVTITQFCKDSFPFLLGKKAFIVNDPIALSDFKSQSLLQEDVIKIGWVGNLIEKKRLDTAVRVVSKLNYDKNKFKLIVFGEKREPVYSEIQVLISELNAKDFVDFVGVKSPIEPWLENCDVLLATAESEGMGRSLVEAMLLGVPVVASDHGGHREVISHNKNGLLTPLEDTEQYCENILKVVENNDLRKGLTQFAITDANSRYSPSSHSKAISSLYEQITSKQHND